MKDLFNTMPEYMLDELNAERSRDRDLARTAAERYAETGTFEGIETELLDALATACAFEVQDRHYRQPDNMPELF